MHESVQYAQVVLSNGQAVFKIQPVDHTASDIATLGNLFAQGGTRYAKLPPGSYQAMATYGGDSLYVPGTAAGTLVVAPTCPFQTIALVS